MKIGKLSVLGWTSAAALSASMALFAADWPQWRGPARDGISREAGLLAEWPEAGPPLLWRIDGIGKGYSTPAVAGGRLYLQSSEGADDEVARAYNVKDGKSLWTARLGKIGNPDQRPPYPTSRSTPTVEGDLLWALGSDGDLVCLESASGKERWRKSLRDDFGGAPGTWAYAESPLIDGDAVVVTPGGESATIVKLDKKSGAVIWKSAVPGGDAAGYASITIAEIAGARQYIQFVAKGVIGVDAKTGKFLWRYGKTAQNSPANIPTPVAHDGHVFSGTGRGGAGLVKVTSKDGEWTAEEIYFTDKMPTSIGGAVRIGDHLYGTTSQGILCGGFKTAEIAWQERGIGAGSLCVAEGRIYIHGENGDVALVEATPEAYREKGRFTPPGRPDSGNSKAWAYPAVADGRLYIRELGVLWCYDVRAPGR